MEKMRSGKESGNVARPNISKILNKYPVGNRNGGENIGHPKKMAFLVADLGVVGLRCMCKSEPKSKIPWRNEGEHVGVCKWMRQQLKRPNLRKI